MCDNIIIVRYRWNAFAGVCRGAKTKKGNVMKSISGKERLSLLSKGGGRVFACAAALSAWVASGAVRTVEMSSYDEATHTAAVTIGAGDGTKGDVKYLFAAFGNADRGATPSDWEDVRYVRTVYASAAPETLEWTLPDDWQASSGVLRFFLESPNGPRKQEGFYLASYGVGSGYNAPTNHPNGTSFLQWIDTGIKASSDVSITIETSVASTAGTAPFGAAYSFFAFAGNAATHPTYYSFGHSGTMPTTTKYNPSGDDGVHQLKLGKDGFFIDGVRIADAMSDAKFGASFTANNTIWLFGRNRTDVDATITPSTTDKQVSDMVSNLKLGWCRIWSAQIATNGVPARSFAPRKVGNVPVMWDSVTGTAFYNAGGSHDFQYASQSVTLSDGVLETSSAPYALAPRIEVAGREAGNIILAVHGDGRGGALYAVRGAEDMGTAAGPSDWEDAVAIGVIPAGATTYTATLPAAWWKAGGHARFFVAGNTAYDFELESLSSTGKGSYTAGTSNDGPGDQGYQYVDTGIVPSNTTTIAMRACFPKDMDMAPFGHASRYYFFLTKGSIWSAFSILDGSSNTDNAMSASLADYPGLAVSDGNAHEIVFGPDGAFVDGKDWWKTVKGASPSATAGIMKLNQTMTLFARRGWDATGANSITKFGACTIYWAKIWKDDALVRDYIPVEKDGVGYLYDKVTKKLFGNVNTTFGTAGTEVGPEPFVKGMAVASLSAGDVLAVSERIALDRGTKIILR